MEVNKGFSGESANINLGYHSIQREQIKQDLMVNVGFHLFHNNYSLIQIFLEIIKILNRGTFVMTHKRLSALTSLLKGF